MLMADSCCSMAEANIVKQLSSVKKKKIMRETCKYPIGIFLLWSAVFAKALSFVNNSDPPQKKTLLLINLWSCTNVKEKKNNKEVTNVGKNVKERSSYKKKFLELWRV